MKRIVSILLLSLIGAGIAGPYLLFSILQLDLKYERYEELEKYQLSGRVEVLDLSGKNVLWEEQDKEFSTETGRYDVVAIKIVAGKKLYSCVRDQEEDRIIAGYSNLLRSKKNGEESILLKALTKIFSIVSTLKTSFETHFPGRNRNTYFPARQHSLITAFSKVLTPPPRFL